MNFASGDKKKESQRAKFMEPAKVFLQDSPGCAMATVSSVDFEEVNKHAWRFRKGYAVQWNGSKWGMLMHRLVMSRELGKSIDRKPPKAKTKTHQKRSKSRAIMLRKGRQRKI